MSREWILWLLDDEKPSFASQKIWVSVSVMIQRSGVSSLSLFPHNYNLRPNHLKSPLTL